MLIASPIKLHIFKHLQYNICTVMNSKFTYNNITHWFVFIRSEKQGMVLSKKKLSKGYHLMNSTYKANPIDTYLFK